jgi:hypothetical protein
MKISRFRLMQIILEEVYKRAVMVHEIRDMGDDLLEGMMSQPTFKDKVSWVKKNKPSVNDPNAYVAAAMRNAGEIDEQTGTDTVYSPRIRRADTRRMTPQEIEDAVARGRMGGKKAPEPKTGDRYGREAAASDLFKAWNKRKGMAPNPDSIAAGTNNPWSVDDDPDPKGLDPDEVGTQTLDLDPEQARKLRQKESKMKISKSKLMKIIREELATVQEDWDYEGDADDAFLDAVSRGEADGAAGRPKNPNQVDRHFVDRYDAAYERAVEKNTLVLPDAGTAGVEKSRQALKRAMNQRQRQKKLRYKD